MRTRACGMEVSLVHLRRSNYAAVLLCSSSEVRIIMEPRRFEVFEEWNSVRLKVVVNAAEPSQRSDAY